MNEYRSLLGPVVVLAIAAVAVVWSPFEAHPPPAFDPALTAEAPRAEPSWLDEDWTAFDSKVRWALDRRLDTLPPGRTMAEIGRSLVGTAYVPRTLEVDGPERVVINFRGLDCVTFVENVWALSRFVRATGRAFDGDADAILPNRAAVEDRYEALLRDIRYRGGALDGYASRLHYFTDWIDDNERRGNLVNVTADLGGVMDEEPIDFMSTHTEAYRQLADPEMVDAIRRAEARLSTAGRHFIPQERIADVAARIEDGDIIAATSTVEGLDVAHTGLALRIDGRLHLLHAPLVGEAVEISEVPLAERIQGISGQDGIIVARPVDTRAAAGTAPGGGA